MTRLCERALRDERRASRDSAAFTQMARGLRAGIVVEISSAGAALRRRSIGLGLAGISYALDAATPYSGLSTAAASRS